MIRICFVKFWKVFFKEPIELRQQAIGRLDSELLSDFLELLLQFLPISAGDNTYLAVRSPQRVPLIHHNFDFSDGIRSDVSLCLAIKCRVPTLAKSSVGINRALSRSIFV